MPALTDYHHNYLHSHRRSALLALISVALIVTSGCVSTPKGGPTVQLSQQQLYELDTWTAEGKLGLRVNGKGNSASFSWQNEGQDYLLRLHGPFGQGKVSLQKENGRVTLESKDHNDTARSPEQLMEDALGWTLPISELVFWIKGLPSRESPVTRQSENTMGKLETLEQQGWQIHYSDYAMENGAMLPHKIIAKREDVRLVLAIKRWQLAL